jgi:ATP-dependent helicase HepA
MERDDRYLSDARVKSVVDCVWGIPRRRKVVVFAGYPTTAVQLAAALEDHLDAGQVAVHLIDHPVHACREAVRRFRDDRNCNVLVCDASAEEGLNLQFADTVIHAELPADPNRLEQRIGRLDRHGPDTPVENVIVGDGQEGSVLDAWIVALRDGFGIFDRSVSSFQFVIDRLTPELVTELVEQGPTGVVAFAASIPERLEEERREIAEQDQLDAIEAVELTQPVAEALREVDGRADEYEDAQESLICHGKGQLRFTRREHFQHAGVSSYWTADPVRGGEPLIPARDLTEYMNGALSERERVLYGSYDRGTVLRHSGTRLWAAGDPFRDGLLRYVRERDDRGRVYAFWKRQPDLEDGLVIAAQRFDLILEPALPSDTDASQDELAILARRARSLLPPVTETVWVGADGVEVVDRATVRRLASKYSPDFGDVRIDETRWGAVEQACPGIDWETWCQSAHDFAERTVPAREDVIARIAVAKAAADRQGLARIEALRGRESLGADADALAFEERAAESVLAAVSHPRVVVDAIGLVILSSRPLNAQ